SSMVPPYAVLLSVGLSLAVMSRIPNVIPFQDFIAPLRFLSANFCASVSWLALFFVILSATPMTFRMAS
ncbi:hypothetical protein, partial [Escherichia coli]|uniref:hypothetical protein n=1 Tax=Escherichia coli TaxID=562 RepID=UPI001BC897D9